MGIWSPDLVDELGNIAFPLPSQVDEMRGPFEFLEIPAGGEVWIAPRLWVIGFRRIHPKDREAKDVIVLRIYVDEEAPRGGKDTFPPYWDLSAQTLVAQVLPYLEPKHRVKKVYFHIKKVGKGRTARFQLIVENRV